jgi:general secretion pathway protein J
MIARRRFNHQKNAAGFTLLEALIATALLAMILTALATITAQWLPNWNRGFGRVQQNEHLAQGLERIVADLASAEFIPHGRQTLLPFFDGASHFVTFVRTALAPGAGPTLEIVRIAEVDSERGPILVRTQTPFIPVVAGINDREQPMFANPVVLMRPPFRLAFFYAGTDRAWREAWQREIGLPKAIRLAVRDIRTQRTLAAASTATLVHTQLPAECILVKSLADCMQSRLRRVETADDVKPRP